MRSQIQNSRRTRWSAQLSCALAMGLSAGSVRAQQLPVPGPPPVATNPPAAAAAPAAPTAPVIMSAPAAAAPAVNAAAGTGAPVVEESNVILPPEVQLVRFQVPAGVNVEILGPSPEPLPLTGATPGLFGFKVGVGYRLRLTNLPGGREGAELYPVVEVVGHLHRPPGIDPTKFPIRIVFNEEDFVDAVDKGRLVTQIVYLEDPVKAAPLHLPKDEIPIATLSPGEEPLKVGEALGRVMAIVRLGGRRPTVEEVNGEAMVGAGLWTPNLEHCPFATSDGSQCTLPCGPVRGTPPPPGRPWMPRDEYLCDGGDHGEPVHFVGDGGLQGIDPRDAVIQFNDARRDRVLPTNTVCIYAPRYAEVRVSIGPNQNEKIEAPLGARSAEGEVAVAGRQALKRYTLNQAAELERMRARASAMRGRVFAGVHSELRVLSGFDLATHIAGAIKIVGAEQARQRQKPGTMLDKTHYLAIKTAESAIITGIVEGAGQMVMNWPARETVGVETPPNRPGLAVIKRVSTGEAEPGKVVTFVIQFRNMGNTPIRAVSVIDSLLPRLEYVSGSAEGPKGTVFTAAENRVGSTELRWDLPGALAPGQEGSVMFHAIVR